MATETISSYDDLVAFFAASGLQHQAEPAQSLIKVPTRKDALDGVLFIRWEASEQVVHFLQTLDITIEEARVPALALAIAILNHALSLPGFGINVGLRRCYYRFTMPIRPDGSLSKQEIQGLFNLVVRTASEHVDALRDVAENGADPMHLLPGNQASH